LKLKLYIHGIFFNEIKLPAEEFESDPDCSFEDNVDIKTARLELYIDQIKTLFFRQLCKAKSYEIIYVAKSKINNLKIIPEDEYQELHIMGEG
jgi:hypothetical protein